MLRDYLFVMSLSGVDDPLGWRENTPYPEGSVPEYRPPMKIVRESNIWDFQNDFRCESFDEGPNCRGWLNEISPPNEQSTPNWTTEYSSNENCQRVLWEFQNPPPPHRNNTSDFIFRIVLKIWEIYILNEEFYSCRRYHSFMELNRSEVSPSISSDCPF